MSIVRKSRNPVEVQPSPKLDIQFDVPFTHRLRFTSDFLDRDWPVVLELLHTSENATAKLQVWIDEGVLNFLPDLELRLQTLLGSSQTKDSGSLELTRVSTLPGGEIVKNDSRFVNDILTAIHDDGLDRRSYILVIGGGAILDAVGYAAAVAHRGIRLIRFPTTTLAQADSGVGVKNAVNLFGKKNWQGTFAVPWAVVNDQRLLDGLSDRDFRCGFSEAVKVSLLKSRSAFEYLQSNAVAIGQRSQIESMQAIRTSVEMHLKHITCGGDPFEVREARPLDFGHWSAHKLEVLTNYRLRHGEAVAIGVAVDTAYSHIKLGLPKQVMLDTFQVLKDLRLPIYTPDLERTELLDGVEEFRQHLGGQLTLTMLKDVAYPIDVHDLDIDAVKKSIEFVKSNAVHD